MDIRLQIPATLEGVSLYGMPIVIQNPESLIRKVSLYNDKGVIAHLDYHGRGYAKIEQSEKKESTIGKSNEREVIRLGDTEVDRHEARKKFLSKEQIDTLVSFEKLHKDIKGRGDENPKMNEYMAKLRMRDMLRCYGYRSDLIRLYNTETEFQKTIQELLSTN